MRALAAGGPPFIVDVGPAVVNARPVGRVSEPVVSVLPGAHTYPSSAFGDFDGDGFLDLAVHVDGGIAFLRGDGTGRFTPAATLAMDDHFAQGVGLEAGDFDGDGLADLAVSQTDSIAIWKGAGDGTFTLLSQKLFSDYFYMSRFDIAPGRPILADLDGDGLPEVVFRASRGMPPFPVRVYKNDGGGRFHLLGSLNTDVGYGNPIAVDVDGDGRPEIVFEEPLYTQTGDLNPEPYLSIWKLAGDAFTESRLALPKMGLTAVAAAVDWDGDGRPEFVGAGADRLQIFGRTGSRTDVVVVPILLSTTGLLGSRFDSDLLLTNSGTTPVHATLRYTAAAGGGSGTVERDLDPGRQLFAASAVGYLRDAGLPIATEGNVIGTLRIEVTGASSLGALSASVRTTTPAGAGVAYGASPLVSLLRGPSVVPWLVETAKDRTNLALVNAGSAADGPVTLRVEVHPGDGASAPVVLPDVVLPPGAFSQIGRVLAAAGVAAPLGWARILRVDGNAPYLAWAAVNDAGSGDGSFVAALPEDEALSYSPWVVPSAVQTGRYATEFVATNPGVNPVTLSVKLVATDTVLEETLAPGATFYVPDFFAELRRRGLPNAPAADAEVMSPLSLTGGVVASGFGFPMLYAGIRVSSAPSAGRSYGVFEPAMPPDAHFPSWEPRGSSAVVPDLRQDERTRTNLGIVNLTETYYHSPMTFRVEITDGETGRLVAARDDLRLEVNELRQLNAILNDLAPGTKRAWARVTPLPNPNVMYAVRFAAYAVVNDGPEPGQGTGDGSFVPGIPE